MRVQGLHQETQNEFNGGANMETKRWPKTNEGVADEPTFLALV